MVSHRDHPKIIIKAKSKAEKSVHGFKDLQTFQGAVLQDAKPSFTEMLRIAEEVIDDIGMQMPSKLKSGLSRKPRKSRFLRGSLRTRCVNNIEY